MEVVTRRQSGNLTHVLCVEKNETPAAEQNKKGFCPADSSLSLKNLKVPRQTFFFSPRSLFLIQNYKRKC